MKELLNINFAMILTQINREWLLVLESILVFIRLQNDLLLAEFEWNNMEIYLFFKNFYTINFMIISFPNVF